MFDIKDMKIFKDPVHGYISIPKCFVEHLIDTEAWAIWLTYPSHTSGPGGAYARYAHELP